MTTYRYPNERFILTATLLLVFLVIALTATATLCASLIFVLLAVMLASASSRSHHQALMRSAQKVTPQNLEELAVLVESCRRRLCPGSVEVYVLPSKALNAYTFGLSDPRVVVLYSALFKVMDKDELQFIIGHEMGHVALGHTWLNSLMGGMAGIPSPSSAAALLTLAFLSWNRACEFSADRAGLLACGKPEKAVTALVKLVAGPEAMTQAGIQRAYRQIDAEDDTWLGALAEAFATHPMLIRRIEELRSYARSQEYQRLLCQLA